MLQRLVLAGVRAVRRFQFAENDGGYNGQRSQNKKRFVDAADHLRRIGMETIGDEEGGSERRYRDAEAD